MPESKLITSALDALSRYISDNHLRNTPERRAILKRIIVNGKAISAESLWQQVIDDGFAVSRASVYNTLRLLCRAGLVRRDVSPDGITVYERATERNISCVTRLICQRCGKVKEVRDRQATDVMKSLQYKAFTPQAYTLNVQGLCSRCRKALTQHLLSNP